MQAKAQHEISDQSVTERTVSEQHRKGAKYETKHFIGGSGYFSV